MSEREIKKVCEVYTSMLLERIPEVLQKSGNASDEYVNCSEAARILGISQVRLRARKDEFPHIKGDGQQGRLLFLKSALLSTYGKTSNLL